MSVVTVFLFPIFLFGSKKGHVSCSVVVVVEFLFYCEMMSLALRVLLLCADHEKQNGAIEMGHLPPPKFAWLGTGNTSPSAKLSPSTSARMNPKLSGALSNTVSQVALLFRV